MSDLCRIIYYSRNHLTGGPEATAGHIRQILSASQRNNARAAITGALMFNAGCFAQVLEGPKAEVEQTFERIQMDERHSDVTLLDLSWTSRRDFPNWSMAFVGISAADQTRFAGIGAESGFDPSKMSGERLHELLYSLTLQEEQPA